MYLHSNESKRKKDYLWINWLVVPDHKHLFHRWVISPVKWAPDSLVGHWKITCRVHTMSHLNTYKGIIIHKTKINIACNIDYINIYAVENVVLKRVTPFCLNKWMPFFVVTCKLQSTQFHSVNVKTSTVDY